MSSAGRSGAAAGHEHPVCQFSGDACSTQSGHYRKVISHIFGRNKKCTVGIPDYVWIYYCRKHYQRARYRTGEWPFRQCDLAMDTVRNMREWGGVESFNLQLRRRETNRTSAGEEAGLAEQVESNLPLATSASRESISTAPTAGPTSPILPSPVENSIKVKADPDAGEDDSENEEPDEESVDEVAETTPANTPAPEFAGRTKKSPTVVPRPVPDWLHPRIGERKTFDEILQLLQDLRAHMLGTVARNENPHFPDVEILPNLRPRAAATKKSGLGKRPGARVSERGAVTKSKNTSGRK